MSSLLNKVLVFAMQEHMWQDMVQCVHSQPWGGGGSQISGITEHTAQPTGQGQWETWFQKWGRWWLIDNTWACPLYEPYVHVHMYTCAPTRVQVHKHAHTISHYVCKLGHFTDNHHKVRWEDRAHRSCSRAVSPGWFAVLCALWTRGPMVVSKALGSAERWGQG